MNTNTLEIELDGGYMIIRDKSGTLRVWVDEYNYSVDGDPIITGLVAKIEKQKREIDNLNGTQDDTGPL